MNILLHPTDFSPNSDGAFLTACAIARDQKALLFVLHVVNPNACAEGDLDGDSLNPTRNLYHKIWNHFDRMRDLAGDTCIDFEIRVGDVCSSIIDFVDQKHCDVIVLAGRNQSDSHYQTFGCISEGLIRRAPCAVLTLRHCHAKEMSEPLPDQQYAFTHATDSSKYREFEFKHRAAK